MGGDTPPRERLRTILPYYLVKAGEPVRPLTRFDFEAIVAAVSSLATNRVAMGATHELPRLRAPLETFILRHFGLDP